MQISRVNSNRITINTPSKNVNFKGDVENQPQPQKNDDDKYVKVPRWQHDLENLIFGILTAFTIIEGIVLLANRKSENHIKIH